MVIWIIGLSGAGKTTLAKEVVRLARQHVPNIALVDGDDLRAVWGDNLGHSLSERKKNADRLNRLCSYLEQQNIHAVAAILSLFEESREWNRTHLKNYYEVFIKTPLADLRQRDPKGLYAKAEQGEIKLPGINLPFSEPAKPDIIINNTASQKELLAYAQILVQKIKDNNAS